MDVDEPTVVFCRECVDDLEQGSIFCSSRCLEENFERHRDDVHIPERERKEEEMRDEGEVVFEAEDEMRYPAKKIEEYIVSLHDALADWQRRTEASVS
jgi:hypothetical protein